MADHDQTQWIRAGWLIDGTGQPAIRNVLIGIRDGRIVSIGPGTSQPCHALDLSHATVLPTLMDAHVHLAFSGSLDDRVRAAQLDQTPAEAGAAVRCHLREQWRCGVAAVRDGGDRLGAALEYKLAHDATEDRPVTVKSCGRAWHAEGRYGRMLGRAVPAGSSPGETVAAQMASIDHLKVVQSGLNSIDRFGWTGSPQFDEAALGAMTAAARQAGRPVMVHANGALPVRLALAAGCDSIEHGYFMGEENLQRMADRGVCWVPTVVPMAALTASSQLTPIQIDIARRTVEHQLEQIQKALRLGVVIALGTDAGSQGVDHGVAVRRELGLLMAAGMGLEKAVQCATGHAARLLQLAGRGELRTGGRADFIVVDGPPDHLMDRLWPPSGIWVAGVRRPLQHSGGEAPASPA